MAGQASSLQLELGYMREACYGLLLSVGLDWAAWKLGRTGHEAVFHPSGREPALQIFSHSHSPRRGGFTAARM